MKLAISNIAWRPEENRKIAGILRQYRVGGIEVAPSLLFADPSMVSPEAIRQARSYWADQGIEIVAMQSLLFGRSDLNLFDAPKGRAAMLDYLQRIAELGGALGAPVLVFGSPKNRRAGALSPLAAREIAVEFFARLATTAADCGTCVCIEPNAPAYGCDFITTVAQAQELVALVDHPGFGLHVDAGVMTLNGEPCAETLAMASSGMRHFHVSEPFLQQIVEERSDHPQLGRQLALLDYRGWVSIEMRPDLGPTNAATVAAALQYADIHYVRQEADA